MIYFSGLRYPLRYDAATATNLVAQNAVYKQESEYIIGKQINI